MKKYIIVFLLLLSVGAFGRDWYVNADCHNLTDTTIGTTNINGDSVNIVVAFQNASYGDTIYINQGKYIYGNYYTTSAYYWLTLNDSNISIVGRGDVVIDGDTMKGGIDISYCENIYISNLKIINCYIERSDDYIRGSALNNVFGKNAIIDNCVFDNNGIGSISPSVGIGNAMYLYEGDILKNSIVKNSYNKSNSTYDATIYYGGAINIANNVTIDNVDFINNKLVSNLSTTICTGVAIFVAGTGTDNIIKNCIFYNNYGEGSYVNNVYTVIGSQHNNKYKLYNSIFYNNYNYSGEEIYFEYSKVNIYYNNPDFIDTEVGVYYLQDTSFALGSGVLEEDVYKDIGCYSKGRYYGSDVKFIWDDWTDEFGDSVTTDSMFYVDDYYNLRLTDGYDTGYIVSKVYYVGQNQRYFSVDLDIEELTYYIPIGQKQIIDADETTQEREIEWREGSTIADCLVASWNIGYANRDIDITKPYIQVRLKFSRLGEY